MTFLGPRAKRQLEKAAVPRDLPQEAVRRLRAWADDKGDAEAYALGRCRPSGVLVRPKWARRYIRVGVMLAVPGAAALGLRLAGVEVFQKGVGAIAALALVVGVSIIAATSLGRLLSGGLKGLIGFVAGSVPFYLWHDDTYLCTWKLGRDPVIRCYEWHKITGLECQCVRRPIKAGGAYPLFDVHIRDRGGHDHHERWELLADYAVVEAWCGNLRTASARYIGP